MTLAGSQQERGDVSRESPSQGWRWWSHFTWGGSLCWLKVNIQFNVAHNYHLALRRILLFKRHEGDKQMQLVWERVKKWRVSSSWEVSSSMSPGHVHVQKCNQTGRREEQEEQQSSSNRDGSILSIRCSSWGWAGLAGSSLAVSFVRDILIQRGFDLGSMWPQCAIFFRIFCLNVKM